MIQADSISQSDCATGWAQSGECGTKSECKQTRTWPAYLDLEEGWPQHTFGNYIHMGIFNYFL